MKKQLTLRIGLGTENTAKSIKRCKQESQVKQRQYFFSSQNFIEHFTHVLKKQPWELNKNKKKTKHLNWWLEQDWRLQLLQNSNKSARQMLDTKPRFTAGEQRPELAAENPVEIRTEEPKQRLVRAPGQQIEPKHQGFQE